MKKYILLIIITAAALLCATGAARGATYYVAITGDDANLGIQIQPWRTIQKAADTALAGDTCLVQAGIYPERVNTKRNGAAGKYIIFMAQGAVEMRGFEANHDYVWIEGFRITNGAMNVSGITIRGDYDVVKKNYLYEIKGLAAIESTVGDRPQSVVVSDNYITHSQYGIRIYGDHWLVENNEVSRLYFYTGNDSNYISFFGSDHIIRNNYLHGSDVTEIGPAHVDCFQTYDDERISAANVLIQKNICLDFHEGFMGEAHLLQQSGPITIQNNVFAHGFVSGNDGVDIQDIPHMEVINNTFVGPGNIGVLVSARDNQLAQNAVIKNNLFYGFTGNSYKFSDPVFASALGSHNLICGAPSYPASLAADVITANPLLANSLDVIGPDGRPWTADDGLKLQQGSPAIGSGEGGVDIGAYAYTPWEYDWDMRTDRNGKPAGHYEETPFPITETSETYSITNDEGVKTFYLGAKYYVDGGYDGRNGAGDGSWERPWVTISMAVSNVGVGNNTIIIRGSHNRWGNNFNGVYTGTYSLSSKAGVDDAHRWMLVGYGQERPVLDAGGSGYIIYRNSDSLRDAFITVQRLKLQNTSDSGIRMGWDADGDKRSNYFNTIDVHMSGCGNNPAAVTNGSVYYLNVDHGWIYHCTSEYSYGHGYKIGDGTSDHTIEWSVARNIGWWDGIPLQYARSPVAFDFPTDEGSDIANRDPKNFICRYNIAHGIYNYALQIRGGRNFSVHHNEFYDIIHQDEIPANRGTFGKIMVLLYAGQASGNFYANIIRDPGNKGTIGVYVTGINTADSPVRLYNNLIYGFDANAINIGTGNIQATEIFNNSIYGAGDSARDDKYGPLIMTQSNSRIKNNIVYQAGPHKCLRECLWVSGCSTERSNNVYYAPRGSIGVPLQSGEYNADPLWQDLPGGAYASSAMALTSDSPAKDSGTSFPASFAFDFVGIFRPQGSAWDIGAYEYAEGGAAVPYGDVSADGTITAYDAALALQLGKTELEAAQIGQKAVGLL